MKRKGIAIISALVITVGSIAGAVYADNVNTKTQGSSQQVLENRKAVEQNQAVGVDNNETYYNGSCHSSKNANKDIVKIMKENGFEDAAKYMQTGDYAKMNEFMNNLSEEDFQKMIDIMQENGYGYMSQMMQSIGREGMINMHNSAGSMYSRGYGMMGGWGSDF